MPSLKSDRAARIPEYAAIASCPECNALVVVERSSFYEGGCLVRDVAEAWESSVVELVGIAWLRQGFGRGNGSFHTCPAVGS